jgi:undecaprenyl phosphate N,N'-diacetylbacillosamine 1-phosphate transferase
MRALRWTVKRILEWVLAVSLLFLTLPLQMLLALAIRLDSPGPALLRQERLGKNGRVFRMWKFRSLRWDPAAEPVLNPDGSTRVEDHDTRLTRMGRFLRLGFDELPQLINVVRGEMALIGPRPDQPFHRPFYEGREEEKLRVLPGITGLPQALGRNAIPWKERIRLDLYYIDHYSLWLDLKIVAWTAWTLLTRRGMHGPRNLD